MMQNLGKIILKEGSEPIDFSDGGKASIHFCAKTQNGQQIEDTRCNGGSPFELRLGKQFCMPVLEAAVRSMKLGEVARVELTGEQAASFPQLAMVLRGARKKAEAEAEATADTCGHGHAAASSHTCGLAASRAAAKENADLYMMAGQPLSMDIELVGYLAPGGYEREYWEVPLGEKIRDVPLLRARGNKHYQAGDYGAAATCYSTALSYIERMAAESANITTLDQDAVHAAQGLEVTLLNNMAACALKLKDYPEAIGRASRALTIEPRNAKALFRRAQAYAAMGGELDAAKSDLQTLLSLEPENQDAARELRRVASAIERQSRLEANVFRDVLK